MEARVGGQGLSAVAAMLKKVHPPGRRLAKTAA